MLAVSLMFVSIDLFLKMFGNWTFGTLVFTVMVITVTLKVSSARQLFLITIKEVIMDDDKPIY